MASQNTTLFAAQIGSLTGSYNASRPTDAGGQAMRIASGYQTTSAVVASSETLTLCKLPMGAKVTSLELLVPASVGTTSAKIGYGTMSASGTVTLVDDDRWGSGKDLSSAGRIQFVTNHLDANYVTTSEVAVVLSPVTDDFASGRTFTFVIDYIVS